MKLVEGGNGGPPEDENVIPLHDGLPTDPVYLQFVIQLAMHNGNASAASRAVGKSESYGRQLLKRHPDLRDIAKTALGLSQREIVKRWHDMHAAALNTIHELSTDAKDERVRLTAAQAVVDRVEGKSSGTGLPPAEEEEEVMESATMRFAAAYHLAEGVSFATALEYAEKNPDQVNEWLRRRNATSAA